MSSPNDRYDTIFIGNYALINIIDELGARPASATLHCSARPIIRCASGFARTNVAQFNLTPSDIAAAIREQNAQFAAGRFGEEPQKEPTAFTYSVTTQGRFADPREFENIILRSDAIGGALRVKDVARVELGALNYGFSATFNGAPTVPIGVYLQPGANALEVAKSVKATMDRLQTRFPEGLEYGYRSTPRASSRSPSRK